MTWREIQAKLAEPFPDSEIEWRIQQSGKRQTGEIWAIILPFITARAVSGRLDEILGMEGWEDEYEFVEADSEDGARSKKVTGVMCSLTIKHEGYSVTKKDGAGCTDIEPIKGGISDAFKRAAAKFGIGKYLYYLDGPFFAEISEQGTHRGALSRDLGWTRFKYKVPSLETEAQKLAGKVKETFGAPERGKIGAVIEAIQSAATEERLSLVLRKTYDRSWENDELDTITKELIEKFKAKGARL